MEHKATDEFLHHCGVERCRRPRVMGTGYCAEHATVESRAAIPEARRIWLWVVVTALPAIWCLVNANVLRGATCSQVEFAWNRILNGAFACLPESTPSSSLFALFSAPGAEAVTDGLTIGGYGFALLSIVASIAFWKRDRAGR